MTAIEKILAITVELTLLTVGLGLIRRGRWYLSRFFVAYVLAAVAMNVLITWWPSRFENQKFWVISHALIHVLKLGVALEVVRKTFRAFPGAQAAAQRWIWIIFVAAVLATARPSPGAFENVYTTVILEIQPRVINSTIWLMVAILALARWYHIPVHPFHSAVLTSFVLYLSVFSTLLILVGDGRSGPLSLLSANIIDSAAYLLLTCRWAHLAWQRHGPGVSAHVETMSRLAHTPPTHRTEAASVATAL